MPDKESAEIVGELLRGAIPVNPVGGHFVTREEFVATINNIETKIEREGLRTKLWVALGCVGIIVANIGGYVSLVSKLDSLAGSLPQLVKVQEGRAPWIQRQEQRDSLQDEALRKLDRDYQPLPYEPPPQ